MMRKIKNPEEKLHEKAHDSPASIIRKYYSTHKKYFEQDFNDNIYFHKIKYQHVM